MNVMKGFVVSFACYIFLNAILFISHHSVQELTTLLIYQTILGFFIILVQTIIIENCLQVEGYNRLFAMMIGFIYGVAISILFSGTIDVEISAHLLIGFMFSFCFFIYMKVRGESKI